MSNTNPRLLLLLTLVGTVSKGSSPHPKITLSYVSRMILSSKTMFYYKTASQGEILCQLQLQSPLSLSKNKQLTSGFLSHKLTLSSDLAKFCSPLVQRSFFRGGVIAITSWAPDVVNLVHPIRYAYSKLYI